MKKWVGRLAIILTLLLMLSWPVAVSGDDTGTVVVTGDVAPTISSLSPNTGIQGTANLTVIISGADFTGASSVSFGSGIAVSFTVNSATQITATLTIASSATAGTRDVSVTVSGATGTKTAAFSVTAITFSITAPSGISLGNMARNQTTAGHSTTPGSVSTNAANWQVVAKDANTGANAGHMQHGSSTRLLNQLEIGKSSSTCNTNAGDSVGLVYTPSDGTSLTFYVEQTVDPSDSAGDYTITIAFIGSVP
jgi:hypothetical protein